MVNLFIMEKMNQHVYTQVERLILRFIDFFLQNKASRMVTLKSPDVMSHTSCRFNIRRKRTSALPRLSLFVIDSNVNSYEHVFISTGKRVCTKEQMIMFAGRSFTKSP